MAKRIASRVEKIEISGIRRAFEAASSQSINLGLGEPDFDTPAHIKAAAAQALNSGFTGYTFNKGIPELRDAISAKFRSENGLSFSPDEIIVTSGASEALHIAILSVAEHGDEVLIPDPGFVSYPPLVRLADAIPVGIPLNDDYTISIEGLNERITSRTSVLIINSPANPTGAVETRDSIKAIAELASDHNITIISDEVYEHLVYDGAEHISPARFYDDVITVNAVSKTYAMTGFRLGYVAAREEYIEPMLKVHQYIQACASSISQRAALAAITGPQDCVSEMRAAFKERRDYLISELHRLGFQFPVPRGAFYVFPEVDDESEFVEQLRQRGVVVTPGSAFGYRGRNHVRISYAANIEMLRQAIAVIQGVINASMHKRTAVMR